MKRNIQENISEEKGKLEEDKRKKNVEETDRWVNI